MEPQVGSIVEGKVTSITKFGAFVALDSGKSGLVHISEIANSFVNDVHDFLQEGQTVIDTGLYGIVRHPMYTATILMSLAIPLVLGSWISFALMLVFPIIILFRIRGEEAVLEEGLPGYREYTQKVRWRLIPYIW